MAVAQIATGSRAAVLPEASQHVERSEALAVPGAAEQRAARRGAVQAGVVQSAGRPHAAAQRVVRLAVVLARPCEARVRGPDAELPPQVARPDGLRPVRVRVAPARQTQLQIAPAGK
ncbi:MAG: hypothetical protein JO289_24610 [Xanthobacteraceae bacterium]|nr:hypothetical protein [Xanthobacteraceae bacterium]